jgi:hypothetical protein
VRATTGIDCGTRKTITEEGTTWALCSASTTMKSVSHLLTDASLHPSFPVLSLQQWPRAHFIVIFWSFVCRVLSCRSNGPSHSLLQPEADACLLLCLPFLLLGRRSKIAPPWKSLVFNLSPICLLLCLFLFCFLSRVLVCLCVCV